MTNFESVNGHLLQLHSDQSGNDRRLVEILVHFFVVMRCLSSNPLLQPLGDLAFNPASMVVRIVNNSYLYNLPASLKRCMLTHVS